MPKNRNIPINDLYSCITEVQNIFFQDIDNTYDKWLYRREHIDFDTTMIKCLDNENVYWSYPTINQIVGVRKRRDCRDMSKNKLISTASLELACDLNLSLDMTATVGSKRNEADSRN
jgi:hypothetical protein